MKYTIEEARRIVLNCAKQYREKLLNRKLIIIYRERRDNSIRYIEVVFYERNYQHLTGVELVNKNGDVLHGQSMNFYRKCIENKLSRDEIRFKKDGTTPLKLDALPILTDVTKITKIIGDYNGSRPYLYVDKVMGGVHSCLGLSREREGYVPSSALREDIKQLSGNPSQVLAILQKEVGAETYCLVKHVAKGLDLNRTSLPDEIHAKISLENYKYKGK